MKKTNLIFIALYAVILSIHISNIWRLDVYPFTDLPNHLSEAYLFRILGNPDESLREYYTLQVTPGTPATIHLYFCGLFADVELGNKIFYTIYILILPLSMIFLSGYGKGDPWIAFLSTLFLYNFSTMWGFSGFTLGIALVLLDMLLLAHFIGKPSLWRALALALVTLLLFYAHIIILLFASAVIAATFLSAKNLSGRQRWLGLASLTPALMVSLVWVSHFFSIGGGQPLISFLISYYKNSYLPSSIYRVSGLLADNKWIAQKPTGSLISLFLISPLIVGFFYLCFSGNLKRAIIPDNNPRLICLIFLIVSSLCYFILPNELPGWQFLYSRFSVFVLLGVVWMTSYLVTPRLKKPARFATLALVIIHAALWFQYFSAFDKVAQPFRELLYKSPLASEQSLASMIEEVGFRGGAAFYHYQNYQIIWNHGSAPTSITDYRFHLIGLIAGALPAHKEVIKPEDYPALLDRYRDMDLLLCRGKDVIAYILSHSEFEIVDQRGDWVLLTSPRRRN